MKNKLAHLATRVFDTPLMYRPSKLAVVLNVLGPRIGLNGGAVKVEGLFDSYEDEDEDATDPNAKPYSVTPDGIACIGIQGTLVKKAGWLDAMSGMTGYDMISNQLSTALADSAVSSIMLCMDTPGGEVSGLFDLVDQVYAARSVKPVYAISDDSAYSAGYAIACAAQKVFVTRTGGVGSIGVIAVHVDQSGMDEKIGLKYTAVFAGARKNDFSSHAPLSTEAHEVLQAEIDRSYDMFVSMVSKNRGMADAAVRKTEAGCFFGAEAVSSGLADQVCNYDEALAAIRSTSRAKVRVPASAEAQIPKGVTTMIDPTTQEDATQPLAPAPPSAPAAAAVAPTTISVPAVAGVAAPPAFDFQANMEEIEALCTLSGDHGMLSEAIRSKMTATDVRKALLLRQKAAQAAKPVNSAVSGVTASAESALNQQATQMATSKNVTFAQAYSQVLKANPQLYNQYCDEKKAALPAQ